MICQKCHDEIPKGKEKYHEKKILCKWCWDQLHPKEATKRSYVTWIEERKEEWRKKQLK